MAAVRVVVFDVNETLSDMAPMADRFAEVGAPRWAAQVWFSSLLRDGFSLTAAGATERFAVVGAGLLDSLLAGFPLSRPRAAAIEHIMTGFGALDVHPDVPPGLRRLAATGTRLVTLTNGSLDVSEALFSRAGVRDMFERLLSVDAAGAWKPAPRSYAYAAEACACAVGEMLLVAVHPWDIDGAARAGLRTAWVNRDNLPYPAYFRSPDLTVAALTDLAAHIA